MSPDAVVWQGTASSLSSTNSEGAFDIMPDHARFMTIIDKTPIVIHKEDGTDSPFTFDTALLFFHDNVAKIYIHQNEQ